MPKDLAREGYRYGMSQIGPAVLVKVRGDEHPRLGMDEGNMADYKQVLEGIISRFEKPGLETYARSAYDEFAREPGDRAAPTLSRTEFLRLSTALMAGVLVGEYSETGYVRGKTGDAYNFIVSSYRREGERDEFRKLVKSAAKSIGLDPEKVLADLESYDPSKVEETQRMSAEEVSAGILSTAPGQRLPHGTSQGDVDTKALKSVIEGEVRFADEPAGEPSYALRGPAEEAPDFSEMRTHRMSTEELRARMGPSAAESAGEPSKPLEQVIADPGALSLPERPEAAAEASQLEKTFESELVEVDSSGRVYPVEGTAGENLVEVDDAGNVTQVEAEPKRPYSGSRRRGRHLRGKEKEEPSEREYKHGEEPKRKAGKARKAIGVIALLGVLGWTGTYFAHTYSSKARELLKPVSGVIEAPVNAVEHAVDWVRNIL